MKVGSISYAIHRGLGYLTKNFYDKGLISEVWVVKHSRIPTATEFFPHSRITGWGELESSPHLTERWIIEQGFEAMLFFETPYDWKIFDLCERLRVRTYLCPMYECMPKNAPKPHKYLCPSVLDMEYFPMGRGGVKSEFLTLPVEYPWKLREKAHHFVHNGGYLGVRGNREGTLTLIDAMQYVKSPIQLTLRCQENVPRVYQEKMVKDYRIEYHPHQVEYSELYATGDVAVGAQRWNGCSLPLQEAYASGMLVINTLRYPMTTWLPNVPLVMPKRVFSSRISSAYLECQESDVDPVDLAAMIDDFYAKDISSYSLQGKEWAEKNSWEVLKPKWLEAMKT